MADWEFETLAKASDADRVLALAGRCAEYIRLETGRAPDATWLNQFFDEYPPGGCHDDTLQMGIGCNGRLIGLTSIGRQYELETDWWIALLLLDPEHRGHGIGNAVVKQIAQLAEQAGATMLKLAVLSSNPRGLAFWRHQGFVHHRDAPSDGAQRGGERVVLKYQIKGD